MREMAAGESDEEVAEDLEFYTDCEGLAAGDAGDFYKWCHTVIEVRGGGWVAGWVAAALPYVSAAVRVTVTLTAAHRPDQL